MPLGRRVVAGTDAGTLRRSAPRRVRCYAARMSLTNSVKCALLTASLGLVLLGCPKKTDDKATKDDEKPSKAKSAEGYARGEVLKHVPAKCSAARLYADLGAIRKLDGVGTNLAAFQDTAIDGAGSGGAKKLKKALAKLDDAGIDPKKDLQELAVCVGEDKSVAVAVGGSVRGKDVLDGLEKAIDALGEGKVEKKKKKGKSYLRVDDAIVGMVSDDVLLITMTEDSFAELSEENDVSADWNLEDGRLVSGYFGRHSGGEKDLDIDGSVDADGDALVFAVAGKAKGAKAKKKLDEDADDVKKELRRILGAFADAMEKLPATGLADAIRGAKISVDDGVIKGKVTVEAKDFAKALDKAAKKDASELEVLFK